MKLSLESNKCESCTPNTFGKIHVKNMACKFTLRINCVCLFITYHNETECKICHFFLFHLFFFCVGGGGGGVGGAGKCTTRTCKFIVLLPILSRLCKVCKLWLLIHS